MMRLNLKQFSKELDEETITRIRININSSNEFDVIEPIILVQKIPDIQLKLLKAGEKEDFTAMQTLLDEGADPSKDGHRGIPVIYTLCIRKSLKSAKYLMEKKPECVHSKTKYGYSLLDALALNDELCSQNLQLAIGILNFIVKQGVSINLQKQAEFSSEGTILHSCAKLSDLNLTFLKAVLKHNPNPFLTDSMGQTPRSSLEKEKYSNTYVLYSSRQKELINKKILLLKEYEEKYQKEKEAVKSVDNVASTPITIAYASETKKPITWPLQTPKQDISQERMINKF